MVNIDITFQVVSFTFLRYISSHKKLGSFRNPSHTVVTSFSGIRNMKQSLQSRFLHSVAPYLSSGILPPTDYRTNIKSFHTKAVSDSKYLLYHNHVLHTAFSQIAPGEANLPTSYSPFIS